MDEEVRDIRRSAVKEAPPAKGLGTPIAALVRRKGTDFDIPELRGYPVKPVAFDDES